MKKNKKIKKELTLVDTLRNQADKKNNYDCQPIIDELIAASLEGEYVRTIQLKVNQAHFLEKLGLSVTETERIGYFKISWK
jgi:hypothetical protein